MIKYILLSLTIFTSFNSYSNVDDAWSYLRSSRGTSKYPLVVKELINEGLYFTSIPYIKEYLVARRGVVGKDIDKIIDEVVTNVGVKQFEVLPTKVLRRSNAPTLKYILAKKYFRKGKYKRALNTIAKAIPESHPVKPFSLFLEGSALTVLKDYKRAKFKYEKCIKQSKREIESVNDKNRIRQLTINRDYCIVGIARSEFSAKDYNAANLSYLDLSKKSYIWPEILFEEAWNSFYLNDYNRTLGKLVTYKAPFFTHVFNPEIDVLKAMTYLHLCLYDDARKTVEEFYKLYEKDHRRLIRTLKKHRKNYRYFYLTAKERLSGKVGGTKLYNRLLKAITRDATYIELYDSFLKGKKELEIIKNISKSRMRGILGTNLKESLLLQRNLIGAYVRKNLHLYEFQIANTFKNMSYINLEILSRRKRRLYSGNSTKRDRGNIEFLKRNEKQYFWTFNGEFWADELGDYVFCLEVRVSVDD